MTQSTSGKSRPRAAMSVQQSRAVGASRYRVNVDVRFCVVFELGGILNQIWIIYTWRDFAVQQLDWHVFDRQQHRQNVRKISGACTRAEIDNVLAGGLALRICDKRNQLAQLRVALADLNRQSASHLTKIITDSRCIQSPAWLAQPAERCCACSLL